MTVEIPLSKGYTAIVDDEDADLAEFKWCAAPDRGGRVYSVRTEYPNGKKLNRRIHRDVMARAIGRDLERAEFVDHINGNPLDCRRSNLRLATIAQNGMNRKINSNNTSGYKGVSKSRKKWRACIKIDGKVVTVGRFDTPEAAYAAYCAAAEETYQEFARFE